MKRLLLSFLFYICRASGSSGKSGCLTPGPIPQNQSWVFHDPTLDEILFIANGAFRVRLEQVTECEHYVIRR